MVRYIVDMESKPGHWVNVYKGNDKVAATRTANFWDERVNVRFTDVVMEAYLERSAAEAEAKRVAELPVSEQFQIANEKINTLIETRYQEALGRLEIVAA